MPIPPHVPPAWARASFVRWRAIAATGGTAIHLGVLEHNTRAERFWRSLGFTELRRQPYTSASGHASRVIVMRYGLR
jgi:ribosomal protein S18 acetylase RimI-like enzyme